MKFSYNQRIVSAFCLTMLILTIIATMVGRSFDRQSSENAWVDHTQTVLITLEEMLASLIDAQAAQRGYVITGQDDYLAPYHLALPKVASHIDALDKLTADNPIQHGRLEVLKGKIAQRLQLAADIISTYQTKGQEAAFEMVRRGTGKQEMDEIRATVIEMASEEKRLLATRQQTLEITTERTIDTGIFGLIIIAIILILAFWQINRETTRRTAVEASLKAALAEKGNLVTEAAMIAKMGDYLQSCRSVEEAFALIERHLPELLPETYGSLSLFNNSHNLLQHRISWGDKMVDAVDFGVEDCWSLRRSRVHTAAPGGVEPLCSHITDAPKGGTICVPMQAHGETFGVIYIGSDTPGFITDGVMRVVASIGEQASLTVANLKLQEVLRQQSVRDPLTKLFNRRYLEETFQRELSRAQRMTTPISVLVMDVDHFKRLNDTHGHDAGDAVLMELAHTLRTNTRRDDIVCRYGGEEFVVAMPGADTSQAVQRAEIICNAVRAMSVNTAGVTIDKITVSVGVAAFPLNGESLKDIITDADSALYNAKREGRDRIVVAKPRVAPKDKA